MSATAPIRQAPPGRGHVGRAVARVEDGPLLTGAATFVDDVDLPGQAFARIVRSQAAHARIVSIDLEAARCRSDVVAAITADDLPDVRVPIRMLPTPEAERVLQTPLARGVVRYVGEPVAVVVATDPYAAEDAAAEIAIDLEPLPCVLDASAAIAPDAPVLHGALEGNVINRVNARHGKPVDELFDRAAVVVRERMRTHRHTAVPMETRGLAASYDKASGRLTVWGAAKVKHFNLATLATMLDLDPERIRLVELNVGGGFGVRGEFYPEDYLVPWLAIELGRPVKWVEDRAEHFVATNHARQQECEIEIGADADGALLALRARCLVDQGAYARTHGGMLLSMIAVHHLPGPYTWDGLEIDYAGIMTNKTPAGTYRGPSQYESTYFRERGLDLVAGRLGIEPAELRRRNLVPLKDMPYTIGFGETPAPIVYDTGDFPHTLQMLLEGSAYDEHRASVNRRRARGEAVGLGVAAYVEAGGFGPFENAHVVPTEEGFVVHVGVASLGQGVRTGLGQIAADELGVAMDRVTISHHDTDVIPEGLGAFASRTTVLGGNAIVGAVRDLHERVLRAAAQRLEVDASELEIAGEVVRHDGASGGELRLVELGCEGSFRYEKPLASFSMGGAVAVVAIDRGTGEPRVERYFMCHDLGRIINPQIVDGQMAGAAAQGIAGALLEELAYSEEGQPLTTSLMDYEMPTAAELPRLEARILELDQHSPESANALGLRGCAESGIIGAAAAVSNAVADAVGERGQEILALPLSADRILALLNAAPAARPATGGMADGAADAPPTEPGAIAGAIAAAAERKDLGAFWQVCAERAERAAAELERRREAGEAVGPLAGVPFAVKDNLDLAGTPTTGGLPGEAPVARRDAEAVARLERGGAVAIGKTAMDPLGWSMRGEAPGHPPCLNPHDPALSPGGSSAGSAVAVAAGIVPIALGTDAAGSVRVPAAYCGIVGLKPARSAIPRRGALAVTPSAEVIGILARSVVDCRLAYEALTEKPLGDAAGELRVGLLLDLVEASEPVVAQTCERVAHELAGAVGIELEPARLEWTAPGFGRILAAELAERWGPRIAAEPDRFGEVIRESAERGAAIAPDDLQATRREMTAARRRLARRFAAYDALLCPTVPTPVPPRDQQDVDVSSRHTRPFNALGWPAIAVPAGRDPAGRPVGVQVVATPGRLTGMLAIAAAIEGGNPASSEGDHG